MNLARPFENRKGKCLHLIGLENILGTGERCVSERTTEPESFGKTPFKPGRLAERKKVSSSTKSPLCISLDLEGNVWNQTLSAFQREGAAFIKLPSLFFLLLLLAFFRFL